MAVIQYVTFEISPISTLNTCFSITCTYLATVNKESTYPIMVHFPLVLPFITCQIPLLKCTIALTNPGHGTNICYSLVLG